MSGDRRGMSVVEMALAAGLGLVILTVLWSIFIQAMRGSGRLHERTGELAGALTVAARLEADLAAASGVEAAGAGTSAIEVVSRAGGGTRIRYQFEPATGRLERDGDPLLGARFGDVAFQVQRDRSATWLCVRLSPAGRTAAHARNLRLPVPGRPGAGLASLWNGVAEDARAQVPRLHPGAQTRSRS